MKQCWLSVTVAAMVALTGCAQERIPADEADLWQTAENPAGNNAAAPAGQPGSAPTPESAAPAAAGPTAIKGSAFKVEGEENPAAAGDAFVRAHYFEAYAPVELAAPATLMETDIEGQSTNGAVPVIGLQVTGEDGKAYFSNPKRPVDGKQLLQDKVEMPAGKYRVRLTYFADTVGEVRPRVILRSVTFK